MPSLTFSINYTAKKIAAKGVAKKQATEKVKTSKEKNLWRPNMNILKNDRKTETIPLNFEHKGQNYNGASKPITASCNENDVCFEFEVVLNGEFIGNINSTSSLKWTLKGITDQELADKIGTEIVLWYE